MMNFEEERTARKAICILIFVFIAFLFFAIVFSGCTYNVSMVHSEGQSTDAIDTEQTSEPDVSATVTPKVI